MTNRDTIDTTNKQEEALNTAQAAFTLDPNFLSPQKQYFLQTQESIFDELEKFSSAWFERRQDAAQAMIAASKEMLSTGQNDPANALKQMADWHRDTMKRLAEDAKECTELMTHCAKAITQNSGAQEADKVAKKP